VSWPVLQHRQEQQVQMALEGFGSHHLVTLRLALLGVNGLAGVPVGRTRPNTVRSPHRNAQVTALSRLAAVSLGETLYQACSMRPFSSTRNAERTMPMYLRPYMDFSPHTP